MKHLILIITASVAVCAFQSCANNKPVEEKVEPEKEVDKLVARVSSVNRSAEYVLIQRYGRLVIPEDSILYGLSSATGATEEQASSLKLTGERLGQFLAADIVSGNPNVGDAVYLRDLAKTTKQSGQTFTPNQANLEKLTQNKVDSEPVSKPVVNDSLSTQVEEVGEQKIPLPDPSDDDNLLPIVE